MYVRRDGENHQGRALNKPATGSARRAHAGTVGAIDRTEASRQHSGRNLSESLVHPRVVFVTRGARERASAPG